MLTYSFYEHGITLYHTELEEIDILNIQLGQIDTKTSIELLISDNEVLHANQDDLYENLVDLYDHFAVVHENALDAQRELENLKDNIMNDFDIEETEENRQNLSALTKSLESILEKIRVTSNHEGTDNV